MDRRQKIQLTLTAAFVLMAACAPGNNRQSLDGSWYIAGATLGGQEMPLAALVDTPLEMHGGRYTFQDDTGSYAIVPNTDPAGMDVKGERGPNEGKTIPAIYKLEHDTLTICYDLSLTERPKAFVSEPGSQTFLAKYTRRLK